MHKEKPEAMKILMVTRETHADKLYGLGRSLQPLIEEFQHRSIKIDYISQCDLGTQSIKWQRRFQKFLAQVNIIGLSSLLYVLLERINMGRVAAKLCATEKYTHVHCHDPIIAAGFHLFSRSYPWQITSWGVAEHGFGCYSQAIYNDGIPIGKLILSFLQCWEKRTLLTASWVIAPTRSCLKQVAQDLGVFPIPTTWHHIYHARPTINNYDKQEARQLLGWHNEIFYVLGVGRITPVKQFRLLVEACTLLKTQKSIQLIILGEGNRDDLQILGHQLGLTPDIMFATTDDIGLYLHAADLYVSTSLSESFGLANLEALTAGTAAICSAVGGVPEVVGDGAILVTPNLETLTAAMQQILESNDLRKTIAKKGHSRAGKWPNTSEIADQYEKIFRQATAR